MKKRIYIIVSILLLLVLQWTTYNLIGLPTLKNKLLIGRFSNLIKEKQDSVFVRDYYLSDCYVGDKNVYLRNELQKQNKLLKSKFKTDKIYYDSAKSFVDTAFYKYNVAYFTYASKQSMFEANQYETMILNRTKEVHKDATYQWLVFFWFKIDERNY